MDMALDTSSYFTKSLLGTKRDYDRWNKNSTISNNIAFFFTGTESKVEIIRVDVRSSLRWSTRGNKQRGREHVMKLIKQSIISSHSPVSIQVASVGESIAD